MGERREHSLYYTTTHTKTLRETFIDIMLDNYKDDDVRFENRYRDEFYDKAELLKTEKSLDKKY